MSTPNVLELIQQEKQVTAAFEKAKAAYVEGLKPIEAGIKAFVIQYYNLFRPLVLQSNKHHYDMPEVRKYELDDKNAVNIAEDFHGFSFSGNEDGFCCFTGYTEPNHCDQMQEAFSISILPKYLGENGVFLMQQDTARIKSELDALDAEYERQQEIEQKANYYGRPVFLTEPPR